MRELHVVAVSEDGRHVVLAATKGAAKGSYRVRLDARLVAAVRGELPGSEPAVDLTPKDIQARLRAGEPADKIARSAGVPVTRVERFAGPVAAEMARTIAAAQDARVVRGRRGPSAVPLGKAVADTVGDEASWTARREEDGRWRVAVAWHARGRAREAAWLFDGKELTPVDQASAALGHVEDAPVRRPARPASGAAAPARAQKAKAEGPAQKKPARKKAVAKSAAATSAKQAAPAKPAAKSAGKAAAAKPAAKKAGRARPATKPAAAEPAPSKKATPAKRTAAAASTTPPPKRPGRAKAPATTARPRLRVVQAEPAPEQRPAAEERDGVRTRASVPAWADVLLGTTPGGER